MNRCFDHEKLEVYQASLAFVAWLAAPGKERLRSIVSMLAGLIKANSDYRLHDGD
jgi:hypothetical protein